jgi:hypothetical protein
MPCSQSSAKTLIASRHVVLSTDWVRLCGRDSSSGHLATARPTPRPDQHRAEGLSVTVVFRSVAVPR